MLTRDVLCCKTLQEMGCIMAAKRNQAASGEPGTCGGWGNGRVRRGDSRMAAE